MLKVGITGGIGSGKSVVCKVFQQFGIPVYNADSEAKKLMTESLTVKQKLISEFGNNVYFEDGSLNRKLLSELIFSDKSRLQKINSIVHPQVLRHFDDWLDANSQHKMIIKEAAILFESGTWKNVDKIITVTAPEQLRIDRVCKRDNIHRELVMQKISKQLSDAEKIKRSDFVIVNDELQLLLPQINKIYDELRQFASK